METKETKAHPTEETKAWGPSTQPGLPAGLPPGLPTSTSAEDPLASPRSVTLSRGLSDLAKAIENLVTKQERLESRLDLVFTGCSPYLEKRLDTLLTSLQECLNQNMDEESKAKTPESEFSLLHARHEPSATWKRMSPRSDEATATPRSETRSPQETPRIGLNFSKPSNSRARSIPNPNSFEGEMKDRNSHSFDLAIESSPGPLEEKARHSFSEQLVAEADTAKHLHFDQQDDPNPIGKPLEHESKDLAKVRQSQAASLSPVEEADAKKHAKEILKEVNNVKKARPTGKAVFESLSTFINGDDDPQPLLGRIVQNPGFDWVCAMMILSNSLLIGVITEWLTVYDDEALWMEIAAHSCTAFFLVELVMRMGHHGKSYFFCEDRLWNFFDFSLVFFSIVDFVVDYFAGGQSSKFGASMKIIKMLRIVRIFRVFRFFRELALLALMIADSIKSLMWALVTLFILMYVFAICFTSSATDFLKNRPPDFDPPTVRQVEKNWGTLAKAINSLVQSMLGGVSWGEISDPLFNTGWITGGLFFFYIFFTMLAVLNIITGVFVDNAVETAKSQREFLVQKEMELKEKYLGEMRDLFHAIDVDGSGSLTMEEIQDHFTDIRVRTYFQVLGMDPDDIHRLFQLIDQDESGEVEVDEFLGGCLRLKGEARSIDLHTVMYDCKAVRDDMKHVVEQLKSLSSGPMKEHQSRNSAGSTDSKKVQKKASLTSHQNGESKRWSSEVSSSDDPKRPKSGSIRISERGSSSTNLPRPSRPKGEQFII